MSLLLLSLLAVSWPLGNLIRFEVFRNVFITPLDLSVFLILFYGLFKFSPFSRLRQPKGGWFFFFLFFIFFLSLLVNFQKVTLFSIAYFGRFFLYASLFWSLSKLKFPSHKILVFWSLSAIFISLLFFVLFPDTRILLYAGWDEHYYRLIGPWLDPNFTGEILVLVTLFFLANKQRFGGLFTGATLFLTFSRSSYLALIVGLLIFFLPKLKRNVFFVLLIIVVSLVSIITLISLIPFAAEGQNLFRTASIQGRFDSYQQGFFIFLQNPILGIGFNNYPRFGGHVVAPDSSLLFVLATTGMVGFGIFIYCLIYLYRHSSHIFLVSLLCLLIHSLFVNSLFYPPILVWLAMVYNIKDANNL